MPRQSQAQTREGLTLLYENDFDEGYASLETMTMGWPLVSRKIGYGIQVSQPKIKTYLQTDVDLPVGTELIFEAQVNLNDGHIELGSGGYSVRLNTTGRLSLWRLDEQLSLKTGVILNKHWNRIRLELFADN